MGYILNLSEDKTLVLSSGKTYVGEHNADTITCYLPTHYKEYDLKDCFVILHAIVEKDDTLIGEDAVTLEIEPEMYKEHYVSFFDISRAFTQDAQKVFLSIEILNSDETIALSNEVSFNVLPHRTVQSALPDGGVQVFEKYLLAVNSIKAECENIRDSIQLPDETENIIKNMEKSILSINEKIANIETQLNAAVYSGSTIE